MTELTAKEVFDNREAAIKRTVDMMLSGWKMLATHCPICNSALLQKEIKVHCASCNMPVMTQDEYDLRGPENEKKNGENSNNGNGNNGNNVKNGSNNGNNNGANNFPMSSVVTTLSNEIARTRKEQEQLELEDQGSEDFLIVPENAPQTAQSTQNVPQNVSNNVSQNITKNIFQSLSQSSAKKVPQIIKNIPKEVTRDIYDGYYSDNDNIGVGNSLEEEKKIYDLNNKKRDLISVQLGEKMLSGWTLLASVCPSPACYGTPLVSIKGKPVTCVACNRNYRISDYDGNYELIVKKGIVETIPAVEVSDNNVDDIYKDIKNGANSNASTATDNSKSSTSHTNNNNTNNTNNSNNNTSNIHTSSNNNNNNNNINKNNKDYNEYNESEENEESLLPLSDLSQAPMLDYSASILDFASMNSTSDPSSLISKKLIKGWALLDSVCEGAVCRGTVPLMRDKEGQVYCVACGYLRAKDGTIISNGAAPVPAPPSLPSSLPLSSSIPSTTTTAATTTTNTTNTSNTKSHSKKRKENVRNDDSTDSDDDEDAEDSLAYSTYVRNRLTELSGTSRNENEKKNNNNNNREGNNAHCNTQSSVSNPSQSNQQYSTHSTVHSNVHSSVQSSVQSNVHSTDAVFSLLVDRITHTSDLLSSSSDVTDSAKLADLIHSLAEAARSVKRLKDCL